jgi:hypothetical protein
MTTRRWVILAAIFSSSFARAADEPLPSAETILDRYVEVTGGKESYALRKSEIETGSLEYPAQGLKAKIIRYAAEPDHYLASVEITGIGKMDTGVTDGVAWDNSVVLGARIKSGEEKALALREASFNATLRWRDLFPKRETTGVETVDGDVCFKVLLTPKDGRPETRYFSRESGLLVKATTVAVTQMGEVPVEMRFSTYRDFKGVRSPSVITQKAAGQEFTITIENVRVNEEIPAATFALPAEIRAILDKPAK